MAVSAGGEGVIMRDAGCGALAPSPIFGSSESVNFWSKKLFSFFRFSSSHFFYFIFSFRRSARLSALSLYSVLEFVSRVQFVPAASVLSENPKKKTKKPPREIAQQIYGGFLVVFLGRVRSRAFFPLGVSFGGAPVRRRFVFVVVLAVRGQRCLAGALARGADDILAPPLATIYIILIFGRWCSRGVRRFRDGFLRDRPGAGGMVGANGSQSPRFKLIFIKSCPPKISPSWRNRELVCAGRKRRRCFGWRPYSTYASEAFPRPKKVKIWRKFRFFFGK